MISRNAVLKKRPVSKAMGAVSNLLVDIARPLLCSAASGTFHNWKHDTIYVLFENVKWSPMQ